jgi:hypothetical protein
VVVVAAVRVA